MDKTILLASFIFKDRLDSMEIIDAIFRLAQRYSVSMVIIEKGQIEKAIGPFLRAEMMKRGKFLNIHTLTSAVDKVTRARSIQARMRASGVKFDKTASWYPDLEEEMVRFPRARHDDQVDAWAYMGLMLDKMWEAPTEKELEEEEYEAFIRESNVVDSGRSTVCGY